MRRQPHLMQAQTVRPPSLLNHYLMQAPDNGPPRRSPQRHTQAKGVDRHSVGGRSGVKIMQNACSQRRKSIVAFRAHAHTNATTVRPLQGLQTHLQRRQSVRPRMNVLHMFYMRSSGRLESSEAGRTLPVSVPELAPVGRSASPPTQTVCENPLVVRNSRNEFSDK